MPIALVEKDRNVIPRWRDFSSTVALGELASASAGLIPLRKPTDLSLLKLNFEENRTPAFAADLLSAALVSSQEQVAREAAEFIVSHVEPSPENHSLLGMARSVLIQTRETMVVDARRTTGEISAVQPRIAALRHHLRRFPEDAIGWVDLSLLFARTGLAIKATKAMLAALGLEPTNRFVLRSAARLFIHVGDLDKARDLLRRSPLAKVDPWVMGAEIAVSLAAKREPTSVSVGMSALKRKTFSWRDSTELAVALATLEWHSGSNRNARRLVGLALNQPNENSLAQANHIAKDLRGSLIDTRVERFPVERAFEVSFAQAYRRGDWALAGASAVDWLHDQPFSSRPAIAGSYMYSSILDDFAKAESLARQGQIANPEEPSLNVELAYIYASTNRTNEARAELARIKPSDLEDSAIFLSANYGLIAYREGHIDMGRKLYLDAVEGARVNSNGRLEAQALLFWAREEILAHTQAEDTLLAAAEEAVKRSGNPEAPFLMEKMKRLAAVAKSQGRANVLPSVRFPTPM